MQDMCEDDIELKSESNRSQHATSHQATPNTMHQAVYVNVLSAFFNAFAELSLPASLWVPRFPAKHSGTLPSFVYLDRVFGPSRFAHLCSFSRGIDPQPRTLFQDIGQL